MTDRSTAFVGRTVTPGSSEPDEALMDRLAASDVDALDAIVARHWDVVVDYAARALRCVDDAEDLAQEAFMALWTGRQGWSEATRPRPLLLRMIRNRVLNERRWQDVRVRSEGKVRSIETARRPPDPSEVLDARELEHAFREAFDSLSPRKREVFNLARFQGLSYAEIGDVLGTSPQTVANQMSAALHELRQVLRQSEQRRADSAS